MQAIRWMQKHGQTVWLDHAYELEFFPEDVRGLIADGLIDGVTSSAGLRQGRFTQSLLDQADLRLLSHAGVSEEKALADLLVLQFREACDLFMPVFERSNAQGGVVSLDLDPRTFGDEAFTTQSALNLWERINRPNFMLSVPVTEGTLPVISNLLEHGVNINASMIYSLRQYLGALEAYLGALERRLERNVGIDHIISAASFFILDLDRVANQRLQSFKGEGTEAQRAGALVDQIGMAIARLAYAQQSVSFNDDRFLKLKEQGANAQRLLWVGFGRDKSRSRDQYMEKLIGPGTVTAMQLETLTSEVPAGEEAEQSLEEGLSEARGKLAALESLGISLDEVVPELQAQLITERKQDYEQVLVQLGERRAMHEQELGVIQEHYQAVLDEIIEKDVVARIWQVDASLWSDDRRAAKKISTSLGWLDLPVRMGTILEESRQFADQLAQDRVRTLVYGTSGNLVELLQSLAGSSDQVERDLLVVDISDLDDLAVSIESLDLQNAHFVLAPATSDHRIAVKQIENLRSTMAEMTFSRFGEQTTLIAYPEIGARLDKIGLERRDMFPIPPDIPFHYAGWTFPGLIACAWLGLSLDEIQQGVAEVMKNCLPTVSGERNPGLALAAAVLAAEALVDGNIVLTADEVFKPYLEWVKAFWKEPGMFDGERINLSILQSIDEFEQEEAAAMVIHLCSPRLSADRREQLVDFGMPTKVIELGSVEKGVGRLVTLFLFTSAVLGAIWKIDPFDLSQ